MLRVACVETCHLLRPTNYIGGGVKGSYVRVGVGGGEIVNSPYVTVVPGGGIHSPWVYTRLQRLR